MRGGVEEASLKFNNKKNPTKSSNNLGGKKEKNKVAGNAIKPIKILRSVQIATTSGAGTLVPFVLLKQNACCGLKHSWRL